jgi:hypothetical protein
MFRAIGFVIILYAISQFMNQSFEAFDTAAAETFRTLETAAQVSQAKLQLMK